MFNGILPIKYYKEYNKEGELIKYINYEENYKFTIEDIARLVKLKYKIDILNPETKTRITRTMKVPFIYNVRFPPNYSNSRSIYVMKINGKTGEIISEDLKSFKE